jgi:hypothetical protein
VEQGGIVKCSICDEEEIKASLILKEENSEQMILLCEYCLEVFKDWLEDHVEYCREEM